MLSVVARGVPPAAVRVDRAGPRTIELQMAALSNSPELRCPLK
jgi:hypothetical protein